MFTHSFFHQEDQSSIIQQGITNHQWPRDPTHNAQYTANIFNVVVAN